MYICTYLYNKYGYKYITFLLSRSSPRRKIHPLLDWPSLFYSTKSIVFDFFHDCILHLIVPSLILLSKLLAVNNDSKLLLAVNSDLDNDIQFILPVLPLIELLLF